MDMITKITVKKFGTGAFVDNIYSYDIPIIVDVFVMISETTNRGQLLYSETVFNIILN